MGTLVPQGNWIGPKVGNSLCTVLHSSGMSYVHSGLCSKRINVFQRGWAGHFLRLGIYNTKPMHKYT